MLSVEPTLAGFSTWAGEGHGFGFANAAASERVRGRVKRNFLVAVIARSSIRQLLDLVASKAPLPHLTYWVEPIDEFGQLARTAAVRGAGLALVTQPLLSEATSS